MSDWEHANGRGRLGQRGRAVGVVLLLGMTGAWLVAQAVPSDPDDGDSLEIETGEERAAAGDTEEAQARPGGSPGEATDSGRPSGSADHPEGVPVSGSRVWLSLLLTDDAQFTTVDLGTGHQERTRSPELAGGDPPVRLTRRGQAVVFYGRSGDTYAAHPAALDEPWRLGRSSYYIPSAHPDRVWLVDGIDDPMAKTTVREVTADGEVTRDRVALPDGAWPRAAVDSGVVFEDDGRLRVWDLTTGEDVAMLDGASLAATAGDLAAWCDDPCEQLRVTDVGSGAEASLAAPMEGFVWAARHAAFSPDGDMLAVAMIPVAEGLGARREEAGMALLRVRPGEAEVEQFVLADLALTGPPVWSAYGDALVAPEREGYVLLHDGEADRWDSFPLDLPSHYGMVALDEGPVLGGFGGDRPLGPRLAGDLVLSAPDLDAREIRAVDPGTGAVRWTREFEEFTFLGPPAGHSVLVGSGGEVVALDVATGEERWSLTLEDMEHPGTPAVVDGVAYVPTGSGVHDNRPPRLYAIDTSSGEVRWRNTTGVEATELQWAPPVVTESHVLVVDTHSYPGSAAGTRLHGFDRVTGQTRLYRDLQHDGQDGFHTDPPVLDGHHVLVATADGILHRIDWRDGELAWQRSFEARPRHVAVAEDAVEFRVHTRLVRLDRRTGEPLDP